MEITDLNFAVCTATFKCCFLFSFDTYINISIFNYLLERDARKFYMGSSNFVAIFSKIVHSKYI